MSPPPPDIPLPHQLAEQEKEKEEGSRNRSSKTQTFLPKLPGRGQMIKYLTMTQNTSAMVFSIFLVPHLASPVVASVMGLEGADKTLMISRDLYLPLEPILIYLPLGVHVLSSISKRLLMVISSSSPSSASSSSSSPSSASSSSKASKWTWQSLKSRLPRQSHQIAGYPLYILLIAHILSHRIVPSSPSAPIFELSPSELGYEYVGYNLRDWVGWGSYLGLVGVGVWHGLVGGIKISKWIGLGNRSSTPARIEGDKSGHGKVVGPDNGSGSNGGVDEKVIVVNHDSEPRRRKSRSGSQAGLRAFTVALIGIVTVGLYRIKVDTDIGGISAIMRTRYKAVHDSLPWAGLW
ncbi:hypothetical protein I302_102230 [Kwoniella bestiolae CBS 10118]|uniref:Mitochondrial adapter protein MCP1 transmembrane domain-containing protein n=1 Tax=Kwoniella bestiolae CBS 10118 TaxID=1296100 RepID=A0A1B9GEF9_9TREE|nr:hypothetical protein I302_00919 [Kwoniella bestiolae CBS 10118]OCF29414.1 hypothetical protein I302_00919 [Kwoniella bestiolae CBS 10118]